MMSRATNRAAWWVRIQAIWWHTVLRRPFDPAGAEREKDWVMSGPGSTARMIAMSCERNALHFPFPFQDSYGPRLLMTYSPYVRSKVFTPLKPPY